MKTLITSLLLLSAPAFASEPVRAEVLAQTPAPPPNTRQVIGAEIFGLGAGSFIGGAAVLGYGPHTAQNERLGWSLVGGSLVLAGIGYLLFD